MAEDQQKLQKLSEEFQTLQGELETSISAREKLAAQEQENKGVQKEFTLLKDDANIYKLVGPVLLKQDKTEATMAVNGRLEYIEGELKRVERNLKDIQERAEKKKMEIYQVQTTMQQQAQAAS